LNPDTRLRLELRDPAARRPTQAHHGDACFDLYAPRKVEVPAGTTVAVDTGLAIELEEGWEAQIRGRSGLARQGILVHPGTIDFQYRLNLWVLIHNLSEATYAIQAGDRIAQMKISRVWQVEIVEAPVRPTARGGLGSSGR
jgi:dUTP pyrophosphatase